MKNPSPSMEKALRTVKAGGSTIRITAGKTYADVLSKFYNSNKDDFTAKVTKL